MRLYLLLPLALPLAAQHAHAPSAGVAATDYLMRQASGTAVNPRSAPMNMLRASAPPWSFMLHGQAFLTDVQQSGPRGGDKLFSVNWLMGSAMRPLAGGAVQIRTMLSLEPATVTHRSYPEIFQTGETAFGRPLVDAQHPHEFFMELAVGYVRPLAERTFLSFYAAPVGDPALGPVGYPHRNSAVELPQATLSHHLQDSTHIANTVLTVGIEHGMFRLEGSGFHGQEPDEARWNIDYGPLDSWSTRLWVLPSPNWAAQVSLGRLRDPEFIEPGDLVRSTASLSYNRPLTRGNWAASLIWGRNHKTFEKRNLNSYLAETLLVFRERNYLTGRVELADKDELFPHENDGGEHGPDGVFRVAAYTAGYSRDFNLLPYVTTGLGANFTTYTVPATLKPLYGDRPVAFHFYFRVRTKGSR